MVPNRYLRLANVLLRSMVENRSRHIVLISKSFVKTQSPSQWLTTTNEYHRRVPRFCEFLNWMCAAAGRTTLNALSTEPRPGIKVLA